VVPNSTVVINGETVADVAPDGKAPANARIRAMWAGNQSLSNPEVVDALRALAATSAVVVSDMVKAGVGVLAGCDSMIAGFCVHDELEAMVRGGMTPLAALQTATLNPVRALGMTDSLGTVAAGKVAALDLPHADPLADIWYTTRIRAVVANGRYYDRTQLDQLLASAETAARRP